MPAVLALPYLTWYCSVAMVVAREIELSSTMSLLLVRSKAPTQASVAPARRREPTLEVPVEDPLDRIWTEPSMEREFSKMPSETREAPGTTIRLPPPEIPAT